MNINHPKSEATLKRHNYQFTKFWENENKVITNHEVKYRNDFGRPCEYRIEVDGVDTMERVQYYGGTLLQSYYQK